MEAENSDDLMHALKELVVPDHAPARARRMRDRAVALLARRRRRVGLLTGYWRFVEPPLVGALSLGFAAWAVTRSVEVLHSAGGWLFWP